MTRIVLNGELKEIAAGQSIQDLVQSLNLPAERLAVEHNLKIVKRDQWSSQPLRDGDKVEIVQFVGGGSVGIPLRMSVRRHLRTGDAKGSR